MLQASFFPSPLPFHRPLALLRLHLQAIGVALVDVMAALRASDAIERTSPQTFGWRDILMEQLGLSRPEYQLFTDGTLGLHGIYGYASLADAAALTTLQNLSLQDFSRRMGVSYDDLFAIVQTRFVNPNSALIPLLEQLDMPFSTLQAAANRHVEPERVSKPCCQPGLTREIMARPSKTIPTRSRAWVKTNFARTMAIITFSNPTNAADLCSTTGLVLRYANPDNTANLLHAADFVKIICFIRLWQKLGLAIEATDDIIAALYPAADLATGASDATDLPLLDSGFLSLLPRLGFLYRVLGLLGLSTDALPSLLACWAPIDTHGRELAVCVHVPHSDLVAARSRLRDR